MQRASNHMSQHVVRQRPRKADPARATAQQTFDYETGQVYSEHEVTFRKKQNADWIGEYRTPDIIIKTKPNPTGARSLFDMAKIKCSKQFRSFTPEHFELVPWKVAEELWRELESTHAESFHAWRTLASVYNSGTEFGDPAYRYHIEVKQPPLSVKEYFSGLISPGPQWLTALRISPRQISVPELVAVSAITNLAVLDLSDGQLHVEFRQTSFDERVMRTWSELASSGRAFQHLRVIMLGWQDTVSDWIFKYLDCFPSLCIVVTTDCKAIHQKNRAQWESTATTHGWLAPHAKRSVKILRPLLDDSKFHRATISNCYYHSQDLYDKLSNHPAHPNTGFLPLVECWLGTPRTWTHILDEFPGTRTVWFEKTEVNPHIETSVSEPSKRLRNSVPNSPTTPLPPTKRVYDGTIARRRGPQQSATSLLADLSRGA